LLGVLLLFSICGLASGAVLCVNPSGSGGCMKTISAAVTAASAGDTINIAAGTYAEQVVINKPLSLVGTGNQSVINAAGNANGIFINGMSQAPAAGVADVLISALQIENANFEGILVTNATDVTIMFNWVHDNNKSLDIVNGACPGIPAFETNEGDDCGEGIHLIGVDHSSVVYNLVEKNSGGILLTDETGPTHDNLITTNQVQNNPYDCGITLASHARSTMGIAPGLPFGLTHNTISQNVSTNNGFLVPGAGAGVGIFAPFPGTTNAGNVVINNELTNNGLPGVTMHNHAASPQAPPVNMNDNVIVGNRISGNGADTLDAATPGTTGINIFSVAPITGTIVAENVIQNEVIGFAFNAPSGQVNAHFNDFELLGTGVDNIGTGLVNATQNWWNCTGGPGAAGCATATGSGVIFSPWLSAVFVSARGQ
jgi:hypothetical protein